jgi:PAS domain S-box-containing protein
VLQSGALAEIGALLDVGVLTVDADLVVTGWNDWLERASGTSRREIVNRSIHDIEPRLRHAAIAAIERAINGSVVVLSQAFHECLVEVRPPAGFEHMARMQQSVRILPLTGEGGKPLGAVAFIQDVTERVSREAELRAAVETAEAANIARSSFFTAMSHELRTPIGAMSGYAELLLTGIFGDVTEKQREPLVRITSVASHLQKIVNEILALARISARREEIEMTDVDVATLVGEALIAVEPLAAQKGLEVRRIIPATPIRLRTDQVKVRQILINLLANAIKFTEQGHIELEASVASDGRQVKFTVSDTGPGIAPADLARIFDPFTRVGRTAETKPGTGLGLALSRDLARLLGGDITVTSKVGTGSWFTASIPREP